MITMLHYAFRLIRRINYDIRKIVFINSCLFSLTPLDHGILRLTGSPCGETKINN